MLNQLKVLEVISCIFLFSISTAVHAQKIDLKADILLADSVARQMAPVKEQRAFFNKNQPKTFKNSNPISLIYGGSLYVYQNYFSQHLSASCLYNPSCSDFSKQAFKEFGLIQGTLLTFDRLNRCNRIAATDLKFNDISPKTHRVHDPVKCYK